MNICPNCLKAGSSHTWGGYTADCEGCNIRGIAISPKFVREHFYLMTKEKEGQEAFDAMKKRVTEEWGGFNGVKQGARNDCLETMDCRSILVCCMDSAGHRVPDLRRKLG